MEQSKPLAKSLHTVSVLVNLARHLNDAYSYQNVPKHQVYEACIDHACRILELEGKPDVYGLKAAALKQLNK